LKQRGAYSFQRKVQAIAIAIFLLLIIPASLSHSEDGEMEGMQMQEDTHLFDYSRPSFYIELTATWIILLSFILFVFKSFSAKNKKLMFWLITIPVIFSTLYLATHTIYKNYASVTKGPIHWHADFEIWACGNRLDLVDPTGMSNRVGQALVHDHNDDRMHIEGALDNYDSATLGYFFKAIGATLDSNILDYPTVEGMVHYHNGDKCPDGSVGTLKVYANGRKIAEPEKYVISPEENVPPGDCVIVIFDSTQSDSTNRVCTSWQAKQWSYEYYAQRYPQRLVGRAG